MTARAGGRHLLFAVPALVAVLTSCASPDYTYVKNSDAGFYLKAPKAWETFDSAAVQARFAKEADVPAPQPGQRQSTWHAAFDAAPAPSLENVFASATPPARPVAWAFVRDIQPDEKAAVSLNAMRNLLFEINAGQAQAEAAGRPQDFQVLADEPLNPERGLYGVRTLFTRKIREGATETADQTVLVDDKHTKLYFLLVRCSADCYRQHRNEISTIVESFTVKG